MAAKVPKVFTVETLRSAAKQSLRLLVVPVRLRRAIKKYLREEDDPHIRKKVRQLSESFQEIKDTNLQLPESTAKSLADCMNSVDTKRWKIQTVYGDSGLQYRDGETAAYIASRMPAVFSVCYRVLIEIRRRIPEFRPTRVLDFGAGTGSGFWAVQEVWPKSVERVNIVEPSQSMQRAGRNLIQGLKDLPLIHGYTSLLALSKEINKQCKEINEKSARKHDLVIASYVLGEIPSLKDRITVVRQLWDLTDDLLVLVEPGTPHGANIISQMRSHILWMEKRKLRKLENKMKKAGADKAVLDLKSGAHIVAPCPHDGKCPLENTGKYCHFVQRLQRTSSQRSYKRTKGVPLRGFEDEKFSFVVFRRGQRPRELWPLDGMKLETLKERRANKKPEDLEIDYEDFIKLQVVEVPYIDPRAYDSDTEEEQEDGEGTDEDVEDTIEEEDQEEEESERASVGGGWGRIIFPPFRKGKQVTLDMCVPTKEDGSEGAFERRVITKSKNPDLHLQAKKSFWGDLWPLTTQQESGKEKQVDAEWCRPDQDQKWGAWP
ncbi:PREDICTED: methyltransferase-like protein 17, mitochondrial isoform X1 [Camelina sativa]|uniref:Methyltransferase-like protein 17, mitochondrial isoform X1 n=1 Tax=Camelina sativa TaxID=90675 RepID=A0ABM0TSJ9_CAMSA|nr:PREDICTED: methyltransferase-like protein 17, mitochondrial isoform X1 [Camelina sativa]